MAPSRAKSKDPCKFLRSDSWEFARVFYLKGGELNERKVANFYSTKIVGAEASF